MDDKQLKEISASVEMSKVSVPSTSKKTIEHNYEKIKRNSICPCEENDKREKPLKYKNCCLQKMVEQEQRAREMMNENREIEKLKQNVAASIQHDIDHPLILPDDNLCLPGDGGSDIIIP